MPLLDSILPSDLNPMVKHLINGLVGFHIIVFLIFIYLLVRSFNKTPTDNFRDQYDKFEKQTNKKNVKQEWIMS